jgi:transposase
MARHALTDDEWECIEDWIPAPAATGRPPKDSRRILDGILWILRSGAPWRDLPEEYGSWKTVWHRFDKWNADGTLSRILRKLQAIQATVGEIDRDLWCVDGTNIRAARCAGGGGKKGIPRSLMTMR